MRRGTALLTAVVAAFTAALASGVEAGPLGDVTRVRPLDAKAAALVAEAREKSPTVRGLMKSLDNGDVVTYVQVVPAAEGKPFSGLQYVGTSHAVRFVLIQIAECKAPCRRIELLGHELQHVNDVMAAAWVTDDAQMQRMLQLHGWPDESSARGYETTGAQQIERKVRRDLRAVTGSMQ